MGREIKRVALDFDHPLEVTWPGYLDSREMPDGLDDDQEEAWYDEFRKTDPTAGPGYQLWEDTTEGSPVSPVFADPEELAVWMTQNRCMFAGRPMSDKATAMRFIERGGWSPSMVFSPERGLENGAEWMGRDA